MIKFSLFFCIGLSERKQSIFVRIASGNGSNVQRRMVTKNEVGVPFFLLIKIANCLVHIVTFYNIMKMK